MVSAISAISALQYTTMANNSAYNMMSANNARMNLLSNLDGYDIGTLSAMDTQYELSAITNSLQYKMAKAMLEQIKKQQKEDAKRFSIFA